MLIDSRQKGWFLTTLALAILAAVGYAWFDYNTPGGFNGGSVIGMWYGIIGSAPMVYAGPCPCSARSLRSGGWVRGRSGSRATSGWAS